MAAALKLNSSGSDVKKVQKLLNKEMKLKLTEDGKFGPEMEAAVRDFQKKNNLKVDGKVGPETLGLLMGQGPNGRGGGAGGGGGAVKGGDKMIKDVQNQAGQARKALESYLKIIDSVEGALNKAKGDANDAAMGIMGVNRNIQAQTKSLAGICKEFQDAAHRLAMSALE